MMRRNEAMGEMLREWETLSICLLEKAQKYGYDQYQIIQHELLTIHGNRTAAMKEALNG